MWKNFSSFVFNFVSHYLQTNTKLNFKQCTNFLCTILYNLLTIRIYEQLQGRNLIEIIFHAFSWHGWKFWNPFEYYFQVSKDELNSNQSNAWILLNITSFAMFASQTWISESHLLDFFGGCLWYKMFVSYILMKIHVEFQTLKAFINHDVASCVAWQVT